MNGKVTINLEAKAMIPIIEAFVFYFNTKYPCTDEKNDGTDMEIGDRLKFATYEHLLGVYEKSKGVFNSEFEEMKKAAS